MKSLINKILAQIGYKVTRLSKHPNDYEKNVSAYMACLLLLLSIREKITIVVIGANDGKLNDPIYEFSRRFSQKTNMVLIEPQVNIIPYLSNNYQFHPSHHIFNCAIGSDQELVLFSVKKTYWDSCYPDYAKKESWPTYRAATGITSSQKERVVDWVKYWGQNIISPEDAIEENSVQCYTLSKLLKDHDLPIDIDVLQVDVEGQDDQVIYNSELEQTKPHIILFESKNLSESRYNRLSTFLLDLGYEVNTLGGDTLAILTQTKVSTD